MINNNYLRDFKTQHVISYLYDRFFSRFRAPPARGTNSRSHVPFRVDAVLRSISTKQKPHKGAGCRGAAGTILPRNRQR